jgi:hypothetical protein
MNFRLVSIAMAKAPEWMGMTLAVFGATVIPAATFFWFDIRESYSLRLSS